MQWDDAPPPAGDGKWFKGLFAFLALAIAAIAASILWGGASTVPLRPSVDATGNPALAEVNLADASYSGYRARAVGRNGDGVEVRLDDFEG
jgi:hypothetical protein